MASFYIREDINLETFFSENPAYVDTDTIYIEDDATVTCTESNTKLLGNIRVYNGTFKIDGTGLPAGEKISFNMATLRAFTVAQSGLVDIEGGWYFLGVTDGNNDQAITVTGAGNYFEEFPDVIPGLWIETGRRIYYDNSAGVVPEVNDWLYVDGEWGNNKDASGPIVAVNDNGDGTGYMVVRFLLDPVIDNDRLVVRKVVDDFGSRFDISWAADAVGADFKEVGVYQEFGNANEGGYNGLSDLGSRMSGFAFFHEYEGATLTLGGAAGGFVPPPNCSIILPNVHMSTSDATNFALNQTLSVTALTNRAEFFGTDSNIVMNKVSIGSFYGVLSGAKTYDATHVAGHILGTSYSRGKPTFNRCISVADPLTTSGQYNVPFAPSFNVLGTEIDGCLSLYGRASPSVNASVGVTIKNSIYARYGWSGSLSSSQSFRLYNSDDTVIENMVIFGIPDKGTPLLWSNGSRNSTIRGIKISSTPKEVLSTATSTMVTMAHEDELYGLEVLGEGWYSGYVIDCSAAEDIKVRAVGSYSEQLVRSGNGNVIQCVGMSRDADIARVHIVPSANYIFLYHAGIASRLQLRNIDSLEYDSSLDSSGIENVGYMGYSGGDDGLIGSSSGSLTYTTAAKGSHFHDVFRSETEGMIYAYFVDDSPNTNNLTVINGAPKFFEAGMYLPVGCIIELESTYYARGHSSFQNQECTMMSRYGVADYNQQVPASSLLLQFQYDTGGGYNGTWLDARVPSNMAGITGMVGGIKIKFRVESLTQFNNADPRVTIIALHTNSTRADRRDNQYPIDQNIVPVSWTTKDASTLNTIQGVSVFVIADVGGDLPAGTIIISGDTDSNGFIENNNFVYTSDQPVRGRVVKGDSAPYYKDVPVSGVIGVNGLEVSAFMVED